MKDRINQKLNRMKKAMVRIYFKGPEKIQFIFARFGARHILNRKHEELEEPIRH